MSLTLRLYTDFVCPFCFIAEESSVPRLLQDFDLTLEWCGFELHPSTPRGGKPLSALFPGVNLATLHERTKGFGAQFGVTQFQPPDRIQNSRRALAVAEFAREQDKLEPFRKAAFDAHWRKGADLESDSVLRDLATSLGLDGQAALNASDDPTYLARVDAKQADARSNGVSGIPTFFFGNVRVVGCQPYEALATAAARAGATPRG